MLTGLTRGTEKKAAVAVARTLLCISRAVVKDDGRAQLSTRGTGWRLGCPRQPRKRDRPEPPEGAQLFAMGTFQAIRNPAINWTGNGTR
jgi:hypothetical protein